MIIAFGKNGDNQQSVKQSSNQPDPMNKAFLTLLAAAAFSGPVSATVLVKYDFNNIPKAASPNVASYCAPCVTPSNITLCSISNSLHTTGGPDGSKFRCFAGWDKTYDYSLSRTNLSQACDTIAFNTTFDSTSTGYIDSLSIDWRRPTTSSVDQIQASIFWQDDFGVTQYRTSGPISLIGVASWKHLDFSFGSGSAPLPAGPAIANETFHVELYAWGAGGSTLYLDNVSLNGECCQVPEPTGALLLGCSGFAFILRRRRR